MAKHLCYSQIKVSKILFHKFSRVTLVQISNIWTLQVPKELNPIHRCFLLLLHAFLLLFTQYFSFNPKTTTTTTTDKSRNGATKGTGTADETGASDQAPIPMLVTGGVANTSASSLSVPSSVPSASLHASTSATTLVVSATTFVRKSSLMRRPKTEVWTIDKEYSLWIKHTTKHKQTPPE